MATCSVTLQVHFNANQTHFYMKGLFETKAKCKSAKAYKQGPYLWKQNVIKQNLVTKDPDNPATNQNSKYIHLQLQ